MLVGDVPWLYDILLSLVSSVFVMRNIFSHVFFFVLSFFFLRMFLGCVKRLRIMRRSGETGGGK